MLFTIGGCTVLNMVFDRDIDCKMTRTNRRPMAAGQVNVGAASTLGGGLIVLGLLWSLKLSWLYFILALAGIGLDVLVYTLWLKRRTAWSIFWGDSRAGSRSWPAAAWLPAGWMWEDCSWRLPLCAGSPATT